MLGLLALGLIGIMIYTLIKNALLGKQLSKDAVFEGTIELIIPFGPGSEFYLGPWQQAVESYKMRPGQLKIHVLIDGHHSSLHAWHELQRKLPHIEIHTFTMRPNHVEGIPWMLDQFAPKVTGDIVIIGDAELVPTGAAFHSTAKYVTEKDRAYFIVPQTAQLTTIGEAVSVLNPTLAYTSFFGVKRWRKYLSHPLLSISRGWLAMPVHTFREIDFKSTRLSGWKEAITRQWDDEGKIYYLGFGEKQLVRHYPEDLKSLALTLKAQWQHLWHKRSRKGFYLYVLAIFLWAFPVICFATHPFWSMASICLLFLYRFFSKIVFQERWRSVFLHPVGWLFLLITFLWWLSEIIRNRESSPANRLSQ